MQVTQAELNEKMAPFIEAKATSDKDYNVAMLICPECGHDVVFLEAADTPANPADSAADLARKRQGVRNQLADHLRDHP